MEKKILALCSLGLLASCGLSETNPSTVMSQADAKADTKQLFEGKWRLSQSSDSCKVFSAIGLNVAFKPGAYSYNKGLTVWSGSYGYILVDKKVADKGGSTFCQELPADIDNEFQVRQEWLEPRSIRGEVVYLIKIEPIMSQYRAVTYRNQFAASLHGLSCGLFFPKLNVKHVVGAGKCLIENLFTSRKIDKHVPLYGAQTIDASGSTFQLGSFGKTPDEAIENLADPTKVSVFVRP